MSERISQIVPLPKARVPAEVQLEFPLPPGAEPVREPFVGDLYLTYAFEGPEAGRLEHVAPRHCAELGIAQGDLRGLATLNLRARRPELSLHWYPDTRAVTVTHGGLESGLLLDEGFVDKLAQDVEGDLVVAVPARDTFVATGTGHPDGVERIRWAGAQVWSDGRNEGDAPPAAPVPAGTLLTRDLLVRRGENWEIFPAS